MVPGDKSKGKKPPTARATAAAAAKAQKALAKALAKEHQSAVKGGKKAPVNKEEDDDDDDDDDSKAGTPGSRSGFKGSTQQWTLHEDNQLRRLVDEFGHRKWSFIASKMNGRRGKQCRDRWLNHLKPDIRRGEWTAEEERILVEGHRMLGTRWAALAKLLPGRPENAIKNHWHATLRCKWAQRGGRISELQAYQHSLNLTNGGGGPTTAAQKAALNAQSPFPTAAASAAAVAAAAAAAVTKSKGTPGSAFEFDGAAAAAAVAAAAAAVVGRGGEAGSGGAQAIARALDGIVGAGAMTAVAGAPAAAAAAAAAATDAARDTLNDGEEAALAAMLDGMAENASPASIVASLSPNTLARGAEEDALDGRVGDDSDDTNTSDIITASAKKLDLHEMTKVLTKREKSGPELCVLTSFCEKVKDANPLGESLSPHGPLVEAALQKVAVGVRRKWNVTRVALALRLGKVLDGEPTLVVAVAAPKWRDAADAAQFASGEIKDKLVASIAPLCLGSEPKAAAALAAVAAAAGTTTADLLGQTIGDLAVEAIVTAVTANDREKVLSSAAGRERSAREMAVAEKAAEAAAADQLTTTVMKDVRGPALKMEQAHAKATLGSDDGRGTEMEVDTFMEPKGLATPDDGGKEV